MGQLMKKRAPSSPTQEMQRIIQQIYDDINDVINSINVFQLSGEGTQGKPGDIRIIKNQDQTSTNYYLEFKTDDGWVRLTGELISES
jgi:hypothetical protein|tara:strand:- start:218 stop:478 length:261 start_codon:yes stop_codon:yes gene_type:complete